MIAPFCNACGAQFEGKDEYCAGCGAKRIAEPERRRFASVVREQEHVSGSSSASIKENLLTHPERGVSDQPQTVSRWDRYEEPGNRRPYAHVAAGQQPAQVVDDGPGWLVAGLIAAVLTVLVGVYLNSQQGETTIAGRLVVTTVATGPTTSEIVGACVGSFVGLVMTLRAFFALLNIESALRR